MSNTIIIIDPIIIPITKVPHSKQQSRTTDCSKWMIKHIKNIVNLETVSMGIHTGNLAMLGGIVGVTMHYLRFGPKQIDPDEDLEGKAAQDEGKPAQDRGDRP